MSFEDLKEARAKRAKKEKEKPAQKNTLANYFAKKEKVKVEGAWTLGHVVVPDASLISPAEPACRWLSWLSFLSQTNFVTETTAGHIGSLE